MTEIVVVNDDRRRLLSALTFAQEIGVKLDQLTDAQIEAICRAFYAENHRVPADSSLKGAAKRTGADMHDAAALEAFVHEQRPELCQRLLTSLENAR